MMSEESVRDEGRGLVTISKNRNQEVIFGCGMASDASQIQPWSELTHIQSE